MLPDASPTARALLALELIQASPGITAQRLGARLGVSERAARRYAGILREAGVPVESARGALGGYRLGRGVRLPPMLFSADEALGLVMAVLDGHHDAGDSTGPVGSALGKLLRALPGTVAAQAEAVRLAAAPAPDRSAARPDPRTTATLVEARSNQRTVRLDYRSEAGTESVIVVEPWAVVVRHARWYLLCRSPATDQRRAYRIDRIRAVEVLNDRFEPPADLDPVAVLEDHLASGWAHSTDVIIDAGIDDVTPWLPRTLGRLEVVDAATTRLAGSTNNLSDYAAQLNFLPCAYHIVGGDELRDATRALAQRMLDAAQDPARPPVDSLGPVNRVESGS